MQRPFRAKLAVIIARESAGGDAARRQCIRPKTGHPRRGILGTLPNVKGSTIRTRRDFILRHHGDDAWRRVQGALTAEERSALDGPILATAWYPLDLCTRLERAIVDACAEGDERICIDVGSYTAAVNLASLYRTYQAGGEDPSAFYKKLERLHPKLYDFGSMSVVQPMGRKEVHLLFDFEGFATRTNCLASIGFFRGAGVSVAISGLVVEEVSCQARGNANCLLVARWGVASIRARR